MTSLPFFTPPFRSRYVEAAGYELHLLDWGEEHSRTVIMWHSLARTGRDFDMAARFLAKQYRVICPDCLGRGLSQWARDPRNDYSLDFLAELAGDLLDRLNIGPVAWVGAGMGGILGMMLAARESGRAASEKRIRSLILNDVAMTFEAETLNRVSEYISTPIAMPRMEDFELFVRAVFMPSGHLSDAEWRHIAEHFVRRRDDGLLTVHYDPSISTPLRLAREDHDFWPLYEQMDCPALVLRGANSDLLPERDLARLAARGAATEICTLQARGHTPPLNSEDQIAPVMDFLARNFP